MFKETPFSTIKEKEQFAGWFRRFVDDGFRRQDFHKTMYRRLCMMFGFIAHYDRDGFYDTYFATPEGRVRFVEAVLRADGYGDWGDVERELAGWVRDTTLLPTLRAAQAATTAQRERAELARLKAKYEPGPGGDIY